MHHTQDMTSVPQTLGYKRPRVNDRFYAMANRSLAQASHG